MKTGFLLLHRAAVWGLVFQLGLGSSHVQAESSRGSEARQVTGCDLPGDLSRIPEVLQSVASAGNTVEGCRTSADRARPSAARLGCPYHLLQRISRDGKSGFLNEAPKESCEVALSRALSTSSPELESRLAGHPSTSLSASSDFLHQSCPNAGVEDRKFLAAEYYLDMNRLKRAELSSLEMLGSIDSVLGRSPLRDQHCSDLRLPEVQAKCSHLQACPIAGGLRAQAEELAQIWPMVEKLESEIRAARWSVSSSAIIREKTSQLEALLSMYPVLRGKEFRKRFSPKKRNFEAALGAQLEATRLQLAEKQIAYHRATACLNSLLSCGVCEDYDETLAGAPEFDSSQFRAGDRATPDELDVQAYLGAVQCRQKVRGLRAEAGHVVGDFAIGAGLTIATAGLGTVAAGARGASAAAQTARAATVGGRVSEALARPLLEVSASARTARIARAAILGTDLFWAGEGTQKTLRDCDELLNQLSSSSQSETRGCPGADTAPHVQLMADYRACAVSAFLNIAPNLIPFTPAFVSAYRTGKRSFQSVVANSGLRAEAAARLEGETAKASMQALLSEELAGVAGASRGEWIRENVTPAFERAVAQRKAWTEFADGKGMKRGERIFWIQQREIKELNEKLWNMGGTERYLATLDEELSAVLGANPQLGRVIHQNYKDRVIVSKLSSKDFENHVLGPARERAAEKIARAFVSSSDARASAEIKNAWREWIRQSSDLGSGSTIMEAHLAKNPEIRKIQQQKGLNTLQAYSDWKLGAGKLRTRVNAGLAEAGVSIREAFLMLKKVDGSPSGMSRMLVNRGLSAEEARRVASLVVDYRNQLSVADVLPFPKKLTAVEARQLEVASQGDYQQAHVVLADSWVFERNLAFSKAPESGAVVALDVQGLGIEGLIARDEWMSRGAKLEELSQVYEGTSARLERRMERMREGIEEIVGTPVHLYRSGDDALVLVPPTKEGDSIRKIEAFVSSQPSMYSAVEKIPTVSSAERRSEEIAESIHRVREKLFSQKGEGESKMALGQ